MKSGRMEAPMSFREKAAWIGLVSAVVCFGIYFGAIALHMISGRGHSAVHLMALCAGAYVALQGGLTFVAARATPGAGAPPDERERLIQARSHTLGFYLLMVLVVALGVPFHIGHPAPDLLNFAMLDVVIAGCAVSIAQIIMYRRGI